MSIQYSGVAVPKIAISLTYPQIFLRQAAQTWSLAFATRRILSYTNIFLQLRDFAFGHHHSERYHLGVDYQGSSNLNVFRNQLSILLKCRFRFSRMNWDPKYACLC